MDNPHGVAPWIVEAFKAGRPLLNSAGREVRIVAIDRADSIYPVVGLYKYGVSEGVGCYARDGVSASGSDLTPPAPRMVEGWAVGYDASKTSISVFDIFADREHARRLCDGICIKEPLRVTVEVPHGVNWQPMQAP